MVALGSVGPGVVVVEYRAIWLSAETPRHTINIHQPSSCGEHEYKPQYNVVAKSLLHNNAMVVPFLGSPEMTERTVSVRKKR